MAKGVVGGRDVSDIGCAVCGGSGRRCCHGRGGRGFVFLRTSFGWREHCDDGAGKPGKCSSKSRCGKEDSTSRGEMTTILHHLIQIQLDHKVHLLLSGC